MLEPKDWLSRDPTKLIRQPAKQALGNNRSLPSLARPSLLHRLDRKDSKIFGHPLGTRLDVCNGHTRFFSQCHLVWWTNAKEPRRISKTLHKSDAAPRVEHRIDLTRSPVGDESRTCREHPIRAQGRVFNRACSRCTQEDRRCDRVPCQQKHRFLPDTHAHPYGGECQHNENTQTLPARPQRSRSYPAGPQVHLPDTQPSPPAEKATAREEQARQSRTDDGAPGMSGRFCCDAGP